MKKIILITFYISTLSFSLFAQETQIYRYQKATETKSYWDYDTIQPGKKMDFLKLEGPGIISRFWWTTFPSVDEKENISLSQNMILNIYWDNSQVPAISVPIADFFCQPIGLYLFDSYFFNSTGNKLVFNSMIPMPFRKNARFEIENHTNKEVWFFYGVDMELKELDDNDMYLHAFWQYNKNVTADSSLYLLTEVSGKGRYLGIHIGLIQANVLKNWPWYNRPVTIFLDKIGENDKPDLYIKTIDDYLASGWWDREVEHSTYHFDFTGRPFLNIDSFKNLAISMYRYHVKDPFWFSENFSVTIGSNWNWGNQEIGNGDWSTTIFFYLDKPSTNLPKIKNVKSRQKD